MVEAILPGQIPVNGPLPVWDNSLRDVSDGANASSWSEKIGNALRFLNRLAPVVAVLGLSALVGICLLHFREPLAHLGSWGYLGVFLAEMGNSAVIIIPTPSAAYTFSMGVILNPVLVGLLGGLAAALGELTGYYLGARGRQAIGGGRLYARFEAMSMRWGGGAILAFALLPVPFDVAGIWAGSVRYPLWRFLAYVAPGKVVKVTAIATAGYYGIGWLAGPLG